MLSALLVAVVVGAEPGWPEPPLVTAEPELSSPPMVTVAAPAPAAAAAPSAPAAEALPPPPPPPAPVSVAPQLTPVERPAPQPAASRSARPNTAEARVEKEPAAADDDQPFVRVKALTTGTYLMNNAANRFTFGARGELDIWRIGSVFTYDRTVSNAFELADAHDVTALVGFVVLAHSNARIRLLVGGDFHIAPEGTGIGPAFGATGRFGISIIALEVAATVTPLPFKRLDARAAAVLKLGKFELQAGYRAQWLDATTQNAFTQMFASAPAAGPFVALGFSL